MSKSSTCCCRRPNPSEDSSSVYFLEEEDSIGASIVGSDDVLTSCGSNYKFWSKGIMMALSVRNKIGFIDGSLKIQPDDDEMMRVCWNRANSLVLSWLLNSVSKELRHSLLCFTSALDVWLELKTRYHDTNSNNVVYYYHLQKTLSTISQGNHQSVTDYYISFVSLWDEFVSSRPPPAVVISCNCSCDVNKKMLDLQAYDCVIKFLVGLNDSYSALTSKILLLSPLPALSKTYSIILQQEKNQSKFLRTPKDKKKKTNPRLRCTHCGFSGHTIHKCFQLIGYPPGWNGATGKRSLTTANSIITSDVEEEEEEEEEEEDPPRTFSKEEQEKIRRKLRSGILLTTDELCFVTEKYVFKRRPEGSGTYDFKHWEELEEGVPVANGLARENGGWFSPMSSS